MPAKSFRLPKKVNKAVLKLPLHIQNKIAGAFDRIRQNPSLGAKLKGELFNYYKFRVGDYRIIYKFDKKESLIEIVKIEHRQGVYR